MMYRDMSHAVGARCHAVGRCAFGAQRTPLHYGWSIVIVSLRGASRNDRQDKMANNPTKHQRRSIRLKGYDYSQPGAYFVTICTHKKGCILGSIKNGEMKLSKIGQMAQKTWIELLKHYTGIEIDKFVIMPNHLHGIIILTDYRRGGVPPPNWKGEATSPLQKSTLGQVVAY